MKELDFKAIDQRVKIARIKKRLTQEVVTENVKIVSITLR